MGVDVIPVCQNRESLLGMRCYARLRDVPGKIDIVLVFPSESIDCAELARTR